jgi:hypothetical protein
MDKKRKEKMMKIEISEETLKRLNKHKKDSKVEGIFYDEVITLLLDVYDSISKRVKI